VPTPPPAAPPPLAVDFEGKVSARTGTCPNIAFSAGGRKVVADRNTAYKDGRCNDLSNGDKVRVRGTQALNGVVDASQIDLHD
jgi:hypothetical protein